MSLKAKKSTARAMPVETIITRYKSAQLKQTNVKTYKNKSQKNNELKTKVSVEPKQQTYTGKKRGRPPIKEKKIAEDTEFYPDKVKRKVNTKKVTLAPKPEYKVVAVAKSNKRKLNIPKKEVKRIRLNSGSSVTSTSSMQEYSIADMITLIDASDDLNEEDFMEILTCPSPVWWEEPQAGYNEEPLSAEYTKILKASQHLEKINEKSNDHSNETFKLQHPNCNKTSGKPVTAEEDPKYVNKRKKLENLLTKLKNIAKPNSESNQMKLQKDDVNAPRISNHVNTNNILKMENLENNKHQNTSKRTVQMRRKSTSSQHIVYKNEDSSVVADVVNTPKISNNLLKMENLENNKHQNTSKRTVQMRRKSTSSQHIVYNNEDTSVVADVVNTPKISNNLLKMENLEKNKHQNTSKRTVQMRRKSTSSKHIVCNIEDTNMTRTISTVNDPNESSSVSNRNNISKLRPESHSVPSTDGIDNDKQVGEISNSEENTQKFVKNSSLGSSDNLNSLALNNESETTKDSMIEGQIIEVIDLQDYECDLATLDDATLSTLENIEIPIEKSEKSNTKENSLSNHDSKTSKPEVKNQPIVKTYEIKPTEDKNKLFNDVDKGQKTEKESESKHINAYFKKCKYIPNKAQSTDDKSDKNKKSINLTSKDMKYCLKCSAIFDTEDCVNCMQKIIASS